MTSEIPKPSSRRENRAIATQFLYMWEITQPEDAEQALALFLKDQEKDRDFYNFAEVLVIKTLENLEEIDARIKKYAQNWAFNRINKVDLSILRLAIHELLHRKDIPPIVSINEAIEISKKFSTLDSKRFINGILDKVKEELDRPLRAPEDS